MFTITPEQVFAAETKDNRPVVTQVDAFVAEAQAAKTAADSFFATPEGQAAIARIKGQ